jgi:hypothetical protein
VGARPYVRSSPLKCGALVIGLTSLPGGPPFVNDRPVMRETAAVLKLMRRGVLAGLLAGAAYGVWRFLASRAPDTGGVTFQSQPFPAPPLPIPRPRNAGEQERSGDTADAQPEAERSVAQATRPTGPRAEESAPSANNTWVDPVDGACPLTHPVKAKLTSGIYHLPGGGNYDRTRAERCYVDADAAIADGLRAPKR